MKKLFLFFFTSVLFSCNDNDNSKVTTPISKPVENITPTKDQQERRFKSEEFCKSKKIPVYKNLNSLFVEPEEKVTIRIKDEVVDRAIALCYLELKSEKAEKNLLADFDKRYNVMTKLTPNEKEFALSENPTTQQMTDANWRAESYHVMLWALGYVDSLKYPNEICKIEDDVKYLFSKTESQFRNKAKLRSKKEILDQADLILRFNWACVNEKFMQKDKARLSKEDFVMLDKSVVYERHYSLNWLIKYMNQKWDDVKTDT
jgi:hypothetical protein